MLLGTLLAHLDEAADAAAALEALGDIVLLARVEAMGAAHGESPGEYVRGAVRRFAADAPGEAWLALMAAIGRSDDPARTTLSHVLRWALARDAAGGGATGGGGEDGPEDAAR